MVQISLQNWESGFLQREQEWKYLGHFKVLIQSACFQAHIKLHAST